MVELSNPRQVIYGSFSTRFPTHFLVVNTAECLCCILLTNLYRKDLRKTFNGLVVTSKIDIRKFRESKKGDIIDKFYRQKPTQKQRQWFERMARKLCIDGSVQILMHLFQVEEMLLARYKYYRPFAPKILSLLSRRSLSLCIACIRLY